VNNKCLHNEKLSITLFFLTLIIYSLVYMTKNCYSAAMVLLVDEGILTKTQTGAISAAFYLVYALFQIIGGIAADKYSPFKLIFIGLFGSMLCNIAILFADSYGSMLAIWALNGAVQFGVWPGVFRIMASVLSPVHRRDAIFYSMFGGTAGTVMSFVVAGFTSTWKTNFVVASVVLFICSVTWLFSSSYFVKNLDDEDNHSHGVTHLPEPAKAIASQPQKKIPLFWKSGLLIMFLPLIITSMFSVGIQAVVPTMINESYDKVSPSVASFLGVFPVIVGVFGKFTIQAIYKKKIYNESMTLFINLSIILIPLLVMSFIGKISYWVILAMLSLIVAIANGCTVITATYIPLRFSPYGCTSTVSGIINGMASLGIVCSNFLSPRFADMFGGWFEVVLVWIAFAAVAAIVYFAAYIPWKKFISQ